MTQDPALFEDSPLVTAAVAQERRFNRLESAYSSVDEKLSELLSELREVKNQTTLTNGRMTKAEVEIVSQQTRERDRRLYPRLDELEAFRLAHDVLGAHDQGVQEGKVALRTSDKVTFGLFVSFVGALVAAASKFL